MSKSTKRDLKTSRFLEGEIDPDKVFAESLERSHSHIYDIDLHGRNIRRISNLEQFVHVKTLDLSCNSITKIEGLDCCTDVRELKLYSNNIHRIENLDKLKQLCQLKLQHNKIKTIESGLQCLQKLKLLRLDYNCLTRLNHGELAGCSNLTHLDLSNNFLEAVEGLGSLIHLEELRLSNNKLIILPPLKHCTKLEDLDLSENPLSVMPQLNFLQSLKRLRVERTGITSLKPFGHLKKLQELHTAHNSISKFEEISAQFPSLEILDVRHNQLESWDCICELNSLRHLVELNIAGNSFTLTECEDQTSYHYKVAQICQTIEMVDDVQVLKGKCLSEEHKRPIMRPTSAARALNTHKVKEQLVSMEKELQSIQTALENRLTAITSVWDSLSHPSVSLGSAQTDRQVTGNERSSSRSSSRSRILKAREFAEEHFNNVT
ncbi:protein phosphatase 1 regulatory subunit 7-like isoform X2 [Corticium candelabrum]|uniref:protein phosphatase 1 regulatory subunit 7-like isoform X2 n=1 Tax=Corticium candelabrum TaxID=121492 RepID=UPI002E3705C9|nr:protein phosphatase 1 regulatory subunit 7-like isoform X2 [Corticium candelabrum]